MAEKQAQGGDVQPSGTVDVRPVNSDEQAARASAVLSGGFLAHQRSTVTARLDSDGGCTVTVTGHAVYGARDATGTIEVDAPAELRRALQAVLDEHEADAAAQALEHAARSFIAATDMGERVS